MIEIKKFFSSGESNIEISPGEYEGPFKIQHSCIVDGHGATLWAKNGAVLIIDAPNVTIKNFRIELIRKTDEFIAIEVLSKNVHFENVEVYGNIRGFDNAAENWDLPRSMDFGEFAASERNEFSAKFKISEPCRVINSVYGLKIDPQSLQPGEIDLRMTIAPMKNGMILYGSFLLETSTKILRRIYVSGHAKNGAPIKKFPKTINDTERKFIPDPAKMKKGQQLFDSVSEKFEKIYETAKKIIPDQNSVKGQQLFDSVSDNIRVVFGAKNFQKDIDVDAYAFCLGKNKKVQRDTDLVFFNNPRHESFGVALGSKKITPEIDLNLKILPEEIQSVVICFSIYDESNRSANNFSNFDSPEILIFEDENITHKIPLQLGCAKVFTAVEIYREKSHWKINLICSSYDKELKNLCEFYGVEVF